ncbi:MAG: glucosaminidase domain-containing protein [Bacteroidota bacterium]
MKKIALLIFLLGLFIKPLVAQDEPRLTAEQYISQFKEAAISDMKKTGVPASITMAQGMFESDYGNSPLAKVAKNHFGVKCHKEWSGDTYYMDDDAPNECFRKYNSVEESYDDHSSFLRTRDRYKFLFDLSIEDYKAWANGLKQAGYATNPAYADKLIEIIERYNLQSLDQGGSPQPVADVREEKRKEKEKEKKKDVVNEDNIPTKVKIIPRVKILNGLATINDIPFVYVEKSDSYLKIAKQYNLELWQILEYNEAEKNDILHVGDIVFLKPKKGRAEVETYTVNEGVSMRDVAQAYGVRQKKLYQMNNIIPGTPLTVGQELKMRKVVICGIVF